MKEPASAKPWKSWSTLSSIKYAVIISVGFLFVATIIITQQRDIMVPHLNVLCIVTILYIIVPKLYIINKNRNLKLYVSVYHQQPPPALPWQLPDYFDPNSVKLIFVEHKAE